MPIDDYATVNSTAVGRLLSEAHLYGLNLVIGGVRQMGGTSTCKVDGASTCLVTGGGGGHKSAAIPGR